MLPKWLLNSAAVVGILYFVFRVLKRRFHLSAEDAGPKFEYVRSVGAEPDHLIVVVNGLFGKAIAGRHVVDAAIAEAQQSGKSVVAARIQVCDLLAGYQLFSDGIEAASEAAAAAVERLMRQHGIVRVSLLGSSMGGLVLRRAATKLQASVGLRGLVCMCSPHAGAPQLRRKWWMRLLVPFVPMQCLRDLQDESFLLSLGGAESRFEKRVLVGSPHDETVKLHNALLNFPVSPTVHNQPLHEHSKILQERVGIKGEKGEVVPDSDIAKNLRNAGDWHLLVTSGRHNDATRAFQSKEIWGHIIKTLL